MTSNLVSDKPVWISLLGIGALFIIGFIIIGPIVGIGIAAIFYEGNILEALTNPAAHPDFKVGMLMSQGIASFVGLILLPYLYLRFIERKHIGPFFKKESNPVWIFVVLIFAIGSLASGISPTVEWNANLEFPEWASGFGRWAKETEENLEVVVKMLTADLTPGLFAVGLLVIAFIPAIGEELVFRGMIQTEFRRLLGNPHAAVWVSAVFFSAVHLQFMGFVPRVLLGAFLGYIYLWSNNLLIPIMGHFLNNGLQLLGIYLYQQGVIDFDMEDTSSAPWPVVIVSLMALGAISFYLIRYFQKENRLDGSTQL